MENKRMENKRKLNDFKDFKEGALILQDGSVFGGEVCGALPESGIASGEVVFNTVLSGYQEVITDPSYAGQIITFTYPHIGNYGTNREDMESRRAFCRGIVTRDLQTDFSNWRSQMGILEYLEEQNLAVISGVDTRRLTRHIRNEGAMSGAFGIAGEAELLAAAQAEPGTRGKDLVDEVSCREPYKLGSLEHKPKISSEHQPKITAIDFGIKTSILNELDRFFEVEVVPAKTSAQDILSQSPDGVFLSNGPGDPACVPYAVPLVKELLGKLPIFGICLGFQFLCQALGAETYKLPFGHHGGNHPVMRLEDGEVEITSQNHNFAVAPDSLKDREYEIQITHINLNDQTLEGIYVPDLKAIGIQYHPEAGPGPHDSRYLFETFSKLLPK